MYEMSSAAGESPGDDRGEPPPGRHGRSEQEQEQTEQQVRERMDRAREKTERAEAKVREASERTQEQISRALRRVAEVEDRAGEKMARAIDRAERHHGDVEAPPAAEIQPLIWLRREPASRRPAHTRADIARAALEIADSEGFEAVSMRKVAQRLGAGTMTLYHYIRNKDELIALMNDAVMAEVVIPEGELADDWRAALTQIANRSHDTLSAHHWVFQQMNDDGVPGPNGMRHFEQSLQAVAGLGLGREQTFEVIGQVDDYVFGYSLREVQEAEGHEHGWSPAVIEFFTRELETGDYPLIDEFFGRDFEATFGEAMELMSDASRFRRGLERLLDGIEAEFAPKQR